MTKAIIKTVSIASEYKTVISKVLITACILTAVTYIFCIYTTISRATALKHVEAEIATVEDRVRSLDAQYIALSSKITPEMAKNYGLTDPGISEYISRGGSLGSVARISSEL